MPRATKVADDSVTADAVAEPEPWRLHYKGAYVGGGNGLFHFYDGSLQAHDDWIEVPRDRPDWAMRLLRFENFEWPNGEQPLDFLQALGYGS